MRPDRPDPLPHVPDLATAYGELQALLLSAPDITDFLGEVATLAAGILDPPVSVGITLRQGDDPPTTVGTSDTFAAQVDEIQYGHGEGPCLQALATGEVVDAPDLAGDPRWPAYRSHALAHGVRSSLSLPLHVEGQTRGALNMYATVPGAFDDHAERALSFATQAAAGLTLVVRHADQVRLNDQLREALESRAVIDQALGVIMAQDRCSAERAFGVLRATSQNRNVKLRDVAAALVEAVTGEPPGPPSPFTERRRQSR